MNEDSPEEAAAARRWLLEFAPVTRKCARHDGWSAERQRDFVALLALTGSQSRAAHAVGRTARGAYQLRRDAGADDFVRAWAAALDLHKAWTAPAAPAPSAPAPAPSEAEKAKEEEEWLEGILKRYWLKLRGERKARLAGRIAEADFYVRQLTWIEICLDLGGRSLELLQALKRGGNDLLRITATPMSLLLDQVRRDCWREKGEPERPPLPDLGLHDDEVSTGRPHWYSSDAGCDYNSWHARRGEAAAEAAEAQRLWEEKARGEAEEWARREGPGEGDAA
ncbi:MAG TPA: hypothetical protein VE078_09060 [Thermoanaerobaculia bacterium]|nr:hypothetical protein [Thermoanaerobaculia bacterium]